MNYEQKYKEALSFLKDLKPHMSDYCIEKLEGFFHELKESEVRKDIVEYLKSQGASKRWDFSTWIAWLEKQGERMFDQRHDILDKLIEADNIYQMAMNDAMVEEAKNKAIEALSKLEISKLLGFDKQDEQKPSDKVEPKFKIGDWITNGEYTWKVTAIKPLDYILQSQNGDVIDDTISYVDEYFHLWTIQDAKCGDVLVFDDIIMIFKNIKTVCTANTYILYCDGIVVDDWCDFGHNAQPATKEQRDLLFQKMKEASYKWDAEKKELKKIEQELSNEYNKHEPSTYEAKKWNEAYEKGYEIGYINGKNEQKSAWSEDDELVLKQLIYVCHQNGWTTVEDWLKSLKLNHWKPSEEQMKHLKSIAVGWHPSLDDCRILSSLYNDLLKL